MASLVAHNEPAPLEGLEACDQTHVSLLTANLVPRKPKAIGDTEVRIALVFGELLWWEDVASGRTMISRQSIVLDERVHDELSLHPDRIGAVAVVEVESPTESAFPTHLSIVPHCFGPCPHETFGSRLARFLLAFPGECHFGHRGQRFAARRLTAHLGNDAEEHKA
jgi:hypothetical protein